MRRYQWAAALGAVALLAGGACNDATPEGSIYQASLAGGNEVPPNSSGASGTAGFLVEGTTVRYTIQLGGISAVTGAHIHGGSAGQNGPIRISLYPRPGTNFGPASAGIDGILIEGRFTASDLVGVTFDQFLAGMQTGTVYANVHTTRFPGGEVRGQVQRIE